MKKIGIVGGVAWRSTSEYYRLLCSWCNDHYRKAGSDLPLPTPPITIESLVMRDARKLRAAPGAGYGAWAAYDDLVRTALLRLQEAQCDFAIIANNTMHTRLPAIQRSIEIPILSIIEETARETRELGLPHALVLGTSVTMRADTYAKALKSRGVQPNERLDDATIDELQFLIDTHFHGENVLHAGRESLIRLCRRVVDDPRATAVILACTELPLAFPEHEGDSVFRCEGFTFVDATSVHVRAALNRSLGLTD